MVQLASAINSDCKSRRAKIMSRTALTLLPMQQSLHSGPLPFGGKGTDGIVIFSKEVTVTKGV